MTLKAVIFDVDGTIVDSAERTMKRHQLTAEKMGLTPMDPDDFARLAGEGWHHVLKTLWPETDPDEFIKVYRTVSVGIYPAVEGSVEVVKQLKEKYRLGVITGTPHNRAVEKLREAGFDPNWFEFVHGEDDLVASKPDGRAFQKALEELGMGPGDVLYIGDTINDYLAATDAGIEFIGVLTGHGIKGDFNGARVLDSVSELPGVLE